MGELSAAALFCYTEVAFAIVAGIAVIHEHPNLYAHLGMVLVIAAGLFAAHHEANHNRHPGTKLMPPVF
jgi:drug/metabolite transporter (DMT)-like permease